MMDLYDKVQSIEKRLEVVELILKSMQQSPKKSKKDFWRKFAEEVELVGLREASKSSSIIAKMFWIFIFVCCLSGTTYFIYLVIHEYRTEPTATKVKLEKTTIDGKWIYEYPPMVLCLDTWLNSHKALNIGMTAGAVKYSLGYFFHAYDLWYPSIPKENQTSTRAMDEFLNFYTMNNFTNLADLFEQISLNVTVTDHADDSSEPGQNDITVHCDKRCVHKRMPKLVTERGVCYNVSLHSVPDIIRHVVDPAMLFAITVPDLSAKFSKRSGHWKLFINPHNPHIVDDTTFVSIRKGYSHSIRITTERYKMLNKDDYPCMDTQERSVKDCVLDCTRLYHPLCVKCVSLVHEPKSRNISEYCNTYYYTDRSKILKDCEKYVAQKHRKCAASCKSDCEYLNYKTEVDSHLSNKLAIDKLDKDNRTVSSAKIYFVNNDALAGGILTYKEVSTYSLQSLIGNIGGTLGIWIGASVITLIKMITFCSKRCLSKGRKQMKARKHSHRSAYD